ncbi:MAG: farnesyl diphosphate synthase [Campylobacterota bacterium]|nr:farnesyl diphosphate synthase [Campylobacterota bacterium]
MSILEDFENFLTNNIPQASSFHPNYNKAFAKMILAGGKRFRPRLLLSVVEALEPRLVKNSFSVALAVELLHTYSLIHDDLPAMDNADLRRGNTTLHVEYDDATAILVGDGLNTHAFYLLANSPFDSNTIVKLVNSLSFNGGISGMVLGQAIDCFFENTKLDIEKLKFLHNRKTGFLIASSLEMGAIISQADSEIEKNIYEFGLKLGLLFQVEDDIIDVTKSSKDAGKTTNNDKFKNSFVNLLGLEEALKYKKVLLDELRDEAKEKFPTRLGESLLLIINSYF